MKEHQILDKALKILDDSLDGKFVNSQSLDTAIRMTQILWISIHDHRSPVETGTNGEKEVWDETINRETEDE